MVPIGVTHISLPLHQIQSREQEERMNKRTKRTICLGLTQVQNKSYATLCIPDSINRLTLAWVTSENSTNQLECRLILTRSSSLSLDPISCWLASLLRCPVSTALVRRPLSDSLLASRYHFRTRRDLKSKTLCLVSRQNRQRNRLIGGPPT